MSSDNKQELAFEKPKKPKDKKSIGWFIGVIVLILISITFILPTTFLAGGNELVFGSIRGKNVSYTDQYFQTQASIASASYNGDVNSFQGMYTVMNNAFQSTVANIALNDEAKEAGIKVTDNYVDRTIVNSGYYSNEDGTFNSERYNSATNYEKETFRSYIEDSVASNMVIQDTAAVHYSDGELQLIQDLSSRGRTFDYVVLSSSIYPEEDVISYALSNPQPFMQVTINSLTLPTEEEANAALSAISNGTSSLLDLAQESASTTDGERGNVFFFTLQNELSVADNANVVFSAAKGEVVGPLQTNGGYTIYEIVEEPFVPEHPTEDDFALARTYIAETEADMITAFLDDKSAEFSARLDNGENFFDIADDMGLNIVTVASTTANPSEFPLFSTFSMTDPGYNLYSATYYNPDYMTSLYRGNDGDVLPAETLANGSRLITRIGEDSVNSVSSSYIDTMYGYIKPQMALQDLQNSIFRDPTFEDNFASVFLNQILGASVN